MTRSIEQAVDNPRVRALVLRVNSPGGSLLASDTVWRQLRLADRRKPVFSSLSDTAASGGYYIGAGARRIYASPGTLTGSIGVFGGKLVLKGLFEKMGLSVTAIEKGGDTGLMSLVEGLSEQDRQKLQTLLDDGYRTFLDRVAQTRPGMDADDVDRVAQGRLWTGDQARLNGLVDELGGLQAAVRGAKEAAGIPADQEVDVLHLPESRNLVEALLFGQDSRLQPPALPGVGRLPGLVGIRSYLVALMALRGEPDLCLMPGLVTVR